ATMRDVRSDVRRGARRARTRRLARGAVAGLLLPLATKLRAHAARGAVDGFVEVLRLDVCDELAVLRTAGELRPELRLLATHATEDLDGIRDARGQALRVALHRF